MNMKALIVRTRGDMDMTDVLQVAQAEGSKLFKKPNKVRVLDILRSQYGVIAVVQNLGGCNQKSKGEK